MILQSLKELAEREDLVDDYEWREVAYCAVIGRHGRILNIEHTPGELGGFRRRPRGKRTRVPKHNGDTANNPQFLWGKAEFVFGIGSDRKRAALRHGLFLKEVEACVKATGDEAVLHLLDGLRAYDKKQDPPLSHEVDSETVLVFRYQPDPDALISSRASVEEYWKSRRVPPSDGGAKSFTCLITGAPCVPIKKSPVIRHVPSGGNNTPLASFDDPVFESHGLKKNENAPISREAAEAYAAALNRLLDRKYLDTYGNSQPCRRVDLSKDTAVVFWSREPSKLVDLFADVMTSPETVRVLLEAAYTGRRPVVEDPQAFYAAVISGAKGRAVLRRWMESTVGDVARSVLKYFDDIAIIQPRGDIRSQPLRALLPSTAAPGKTENIPPRLAADMFAAILRDTAPYPRALLEASVRRMRADQSRRDPKAPWRNGPVPPERAALIKAYLCRARRLDPNKQNFPEVTMSLDEKCNDVAYRLGRLFAVLEQLQRIAIKNPNATICDRFFGAASATPVIVFPTLLKRAQHHIPKARYFQKVLGEIMAELPAKPFPAALTLEQQGLFAIGYYHQRQAPLFPKKPGNETSAPAANAR